MKPPLPRPSGVGTNRQLHPSILELLYPRSSASSGFIKRKASKRVVFLGTKMELVEGILQVLASQPGI